MRSLAPAPAMLPDTELDFDQLYRAQRDPLFAYLCGMFSDRSLAEEVCGQAFEKAWRKRKLYDASKGSPKAWLFTLARNCALDELRRQKLRPRPSSDLSLESTSDAPVEPSQREQLMLALASLEEADRQLMLLRFWGDLSHEEIAQLLGISPSNVGTRLSRVMNRLRQTFLQQESA